jgi:hypothetical protein
MNIGATVHTPFFAVVQSSPPLVLCQCPFPAYKVYIRGACCPQSDMYSTDEERRLKVRQIGHVLMLVIFA